MGFCTIILYYLGIETTAFKVNVVLCFKTVVACVRVELYAARFAIRRVWVTHFLLAFVLCDCSVVLSMRVIKRSFFVDVCGCLSMALAVRLTLDFLVVFPYDHKPMIVWWNR